MVELLFYKTISTFDKQILYPGCGVGDLIAAVEQYFDSSADHPSNGVAIDTDEDCISATES